MVSRDPGIRALCYYYFPPCGNITHFEPPNALCQDTCIFFTEVVCQERWQTALDLVASVQSIKDNIIRYNLPPLNCSDPGSPLGLLPHCCSDAGIDTGELGNSIREFAVDLQPFAQLSTLIFRIDGPQWLGLGTICWHNFEHNNFMLGCEHSGA